MMYVVRKYPRGQNLVGEKMAMWPQLSGREEDIF